VELFNKLKKIFEKCPASMFLKKKKKKEQHFGDWIWPSGTGHLSLTGPTD